MPTEMTMRDHFAAAALTGLLASGMDSVDEMPTRAYRMADAMLRERTNHDAAPAAKAGTPGTGGTQEPVAWGVVDDRGLQLALHSTPEHASYYARNFGSGLAEVVPLYRHQQSTLTDAEREAVLSCAIDDEAASAFQRADILRGLLERTQTVEK